MTEVDDGLHHLDDIEDLIGSLDDAPVVRMERTTVQPSLDSQQRRRRRKERVELEELTLSDASQVGSTEETPSDDNLNTLLSNVPGPETVFVKTWGCAHNNSDGEYMAGLLSEYGYRVVVEDEEASQAQVWVLNSCTVKGPAEAHFVNSIADAQKKGKKVVVAGCVPQAWGSGKSGKKLATSAKAQDLSVLGVQQIDRVVEVVEETLKGNTVRLMSTKTAKVDMREYAPEALASSPQSSAETSSTSSMDDTPQIKKVKLGGASLDLPKIRRNPLVEIVPISTGCLNQCTYCKTKHARGHLGSYPIREIVDRIRKVISEGVLEIWLTSEDTGAYGRDIGTDITKLLWAILEVLPEPVMLRMGMTNPPYIKEHMEEMSRIYQHPRIYSYLHMPIQSASNSVLNVMQREYTRQDFEEIVDFLKSKINLNVATDLIIGFPGETHEDYKETYDLVMKYQFSVLFINQFYPRPGTPAAKMKRVPTNQVKDRTRELSAWFKNFMPYANREGEIHKILVTEMAPDGIHVAGRTKLYEMVLVQHEHLNLDIDQIMGRVIEVEIVNTGKFFLMGKPTQQGIDSLSTQLLPTNTVLKHKSTLSRRSDISQENVKKERLDYHEGDDGEDDYIDNLEDDNEQDGCDSEQCTSGCDDCGGSTPCSENDGNCCGSTSCSTQKDSKNNSNLINVNNTTTSATITIAGPSQPLNLKKNQPQNSNQKVSSTTSTSTNSISLNTILLISLIGIAMILYPWLKHML